MAGSRHQTCDMQACQGKKWYRCPGKVSHLSKEKAVAFSIIWHLLTQLAIRQVSSAYCKVDNSLVVWRNDTLHLGMDGVYDPAVS